jgi:hypothetical protein
LKRKGLTIQKIIKFKKTDPAKKIDPVEKKIWLTLIEQLAKQNSF